MSFTREELKAALKSPGNKLAAQAMELIRQGGPIETLKGIIEKGCPHVFYERDKAHPRSRYHTRHVLDVCFESGFGIVEEKTSNEGTHEVMSAVLGEVHQSQGREAYFKLLLEHGFTPGENSWRGGLFSHIINSCFYQDRTETEGKQASARRFAKILIESGRYDIQHYAKNNYGWVGHPEHLDFMISLGANPQGSDMIDCALSYVGCSPNGTLTNEDRINTIRKLLDLGAAPERNLGRAGSSALHARTRLEEAGLVERLSEFGIIEKDRPQEYTDYLARVAAMA